MHEDECMSSRLQLLSVTTVGCLDIKVSKVSKSSKADGGRTMGRASRGRAEEEGDEEDVLVNQSLTEEDY